MAHQLLIYVDNCVFSDMLELCGDEQKAKFLQCPHRIAFSDVHIFEMKSRPDCYAKLLTELDAVFIRNPGAGFMRYHPIVSVEPGEPYQRFIDQKDFDGAFDAFEALLAPLHHFMGGRRENNLPQIVESTNEKVTTSLLEMLESVGVSSLDKLSTLIDAQVREAGESMKGLDPSIGWCMIDAQRKSAREGDPMRNMTPIEKIDHLLSCLEPKDSDAFRSSYPMYFAQRGGLDAGVVTGFAMALLSIGLIKAKNIFSGSQQDRKFRAQFRDCRHIEEASHCDYFITRDNDAHILAEATFAYSGFDTRSVLLPS